MKMKKFSLKKTLNVIMYCAQQVDGGDASDEETPDDFSMVFEVKQTFAVCSSHINDDKVDEFSSINNTINLALNFKDFFVHFIRWKQSQKSMMRSTQMLHLLLKSEIQLNTRNYSKRCSQIYFNPF